VWIGIVPAVELWRGTATLKVRDALALLHRKKRGRRHATDRAPRRAKPTLVGRFG
jgi:hypothetical protein